MNDLSFARSDVRHACRRRRTRQALGAALFVVVAGGLALLASRGGGPSPLQAGQAKAAPPTAPLDALAIAPTRLAPPPRLEVEPPPELAAPPRQAQSPDAGTTPVASAPAAPPTLVAPSGVAPSGVAAPVASLGRPAASRPEHALRMPAVRPLEPVDADMIPNPPRADRLVAAPKPPARLKRALTESSQPSSLLDVRRAVRKGEVMVAQTAEGEATLTLVPRMQQHLMQLLAKYEVPNGAFVAIEPATGRVLALASYSRAHPKGLPFALRGVAPAASIFKLVTAAALLEGSGLDPVEKTCFRGGRRRLYERHLREKLSGGRCVDLAAAVAWSLNVPVAKMAVSHMKPDVLISAAESFGFNRVIPFELGGEPSYARIPQDTLGFGRAAAGFGDVRMSALHGALLAGAIANGGQLMRPYVIEETKAADGRVVRKGAPEILGVAASPAVAARVARMMALATTLGTGRRHLKRRGRRFLGDVDVPGKTGSLFVYDPFMDYSWFVGFAPAKNPRIAFAAVVGNTPIWHIKSGFLAIEGLRRFFNAEVKAHKPPRALRLRRRRKG